MEKNMTPPPNWKELYPEKFVDEAIVFSHIRRGDHIFVVSCCGEPQYLVQVMVNYVHSHPRHSLIMIMSLGVSVDMVKAGDVIYT